MAKTESPEPLVDDEQETEIEDNFDEEFVPEIDEEESSKNQEKQNNLKYKFHCPYKDCNESFVKNLRLQTHIRMKHTGYTPFKCRHCPVSFACLSYLNKHLKRRHQEGKLENDEKLQKKRKTKEYRCTECPEVEFRTKIQLKMHRSRLHGELALFQCSKCDQRFHYRSKLTAHQRRHRGYRCSFQDDCTFHTDKWSDLRRHLAREHQKLQCQICQRCYSSAYNLRIHQENVHRSQNSDSLPKFRCTIDGCEKSYNRRTSLKNHQRTAHGDPKHQCEKCQQKFRHKKSLAAHLKRNNCQEPQKEVPKIKTKNSKKNSISKLNKILRIKPLINEKSMDDEDRLLLDYCDQLDSGSKNSNPNDSIDMEKILESNLLK